MKIESTLKFLALLSLTGCAVLDTRGHEVEPEQVSALQVGVTTKQQVTKLLGTPSVVSPFGNKTWFYMSEKTQRRAFFSPVVLSSTLTRITFDNNDVVSCVDSLSENNRQEISHVHRETPTSGHSFGVIEQIFGNVGRFNGKDPDK